MRTPPWCQNAVLRVCEGKRFSSLHIILRLELVTLRRIPGPFSRKKGRSIIGQDKGPHRLAARSGHKAPQCGAFLSFTYAAGFEAAVRFRQSVRTDLSEIPTDNPQS